MAVCEAMGSNNASGATNGNGSNGSKDAKTVRNGGICESSAPANNNGFSKECSIHIVGTDLLRSTIQAAERGVYPQSAVMGLPPATIRACFSKIGPSASDGAQEGNGNGSSAAAANGNGSAYLLVKPRLRSLVTFNTMNLTKPVYIGRFDCIFCMDVLPHLSRTQRSALMERLHLYLEPGGYLFLSQTEKLCAPNLNFRSETYDGYTFYRKPLAAAAAYGR
jgi:chemotaxis methyl-accepting protein methylase